MKRVGFVLKRVGMKRVGFVRMKRVRMKRVGYCSYEAS